MSTEHLLREFYNQMYRVHTQPGNAYDIGDHLHHLTAVYDLRSRLQFDFAVAKLSYVCSDRTPSCSSQRPSPPLAHAHWARVYQGGHAAVEI
jgi:hypothetical protein